jgi:hypothetical protein
VSDVRDAYESALDGETILLMPGAHFLDSTLGVSKSVWFEGVGFSAQYDICFRQSVLAESMDAVDLGPAMPSVTLQG